jgi:protein-S-isoprenylcysteine O-methyltransferase Ste14
MTFLKGFLSPLPVVAVVAALLLLVAGYAADVWVWPTAWVFLAVYGGVPMIGYGLLAVLRPESYRVRQQGLVARAGRQQPLIDILGLAAFVIWMAVWYAFIPLDVFRLRLVAPPPAVLQWAGLAAAAAGLVIAQLAIAQNRYAAPTIHDQSAEGQQVIDTGLYGVVRHPLYAGLLLVYPGAALWLGSSAAAVASLGFLAMTLARIVIEERWLREHLPDYAAYARRVRGRLIPYLL